mgnify:CR=1 FL=1
MERSPPHAGGNRLAVPNRVGFEPTPGGRDDHGATAAGRTEGIEFWGQSFIADPAGKIMVKGSVDQPEVVLAECDLARIDVTGNTIPRLNEVAVDSTALV